MHALVMQCDAYCRQASFFDHIYALCGYSASQWNKAIAKGIDRLPINQAVFVKLAVDIRKLLFVERNFPFKDAEVQRLNVDRHDQHIRWVVAASTSVAIGHAALDMAIATYPSERFTLRNGILVIRRPGPETAASQPK